MTREYTLPSGERVIEIDTPHLPDFGRVKEEANAKNWKIVFYKQGHKPKEIIGSLQQITDYLLKHAAFFKANPGIKYQMEPHTEKREVTSVPQSQLRRLNDAELDKNWQTIVPKSPEEVPAAKEVGTRLPVMKVLATRKKNRATLAPSLLGIAVDEVFIYRHGKGGKIITVSLKKLRKDYAIREVSKVREKLTAAEVTVLGFAVNIDNVREAVNHCRNYLNVSVTEDEIKHLRDIVPTNEFAKE